MKPKHRSQGGFTVIELLVVVAIIALLSSVGLVATLQSRQKARDARRLSDMGQMGTGLELFFNANRGYPADQDADGIPDGMTPTYLATFPRFPEPADGACIGLNHPSPVPPNKPSHQYYYVPSGSPFSVGSVTLYPDYAYYFCIGRKTGDMPPGPRYLTPKGIR